MKQRYITMINKLTLNNNILKFAQRSNDLIEHRPISNNSDL
ncbi:hypothetical protein CBM2637_B110319 [Cupriavidus taiwanensis]|nr:hypothetical protein CBM2637_B110319 [Cupriavidus taiwanensis]